MATFNDSREKIVDELLAMKEAGKRPSLVKAVRAKCKDCMCDSGRIDCEIEDCSLYFWMPYGKIRKNSKSSSQNTSFMGFSKGR